MNKTAGDPRMSQAGEILAGDCHVQPTAVYRGYVRQELPDAVVLIEGGQLHHPVATMKDSDSGVAHIVKDGEDYTLVIGSYVGGFYATKRWFPEAVLALVGVAVRIHASLKQ